MPRGDRTGPMGMGAMSGRAGGYCAGYNAPGYANPGPGRGFGVGFCRGRGGCGPGYGSGRGWRNMFRATGQPGWRRFGGYGAPNAAPVPSGAPDPETEKQALRRQAEALESELEWIKQRLAGFEAADAEGKAD